MVIDPTLTPSSPVLPTSVGVAIAFGYLLDLLKRLKQLPKVNYYNKKMNLIIRIFLSGIGTLGISWVWSASGTGHQLLIMIPAWSVIGLAAWHWFVQYGMQHTFEGILQIQRHLDSLIPANGDKRA